MDLTPIGKIIFDHQLLVILSINIISDESSNFPGIRT